MFFAATGWEKSWMDSDLLEDWDREQDNNLLLIVDNFPADPVISGSKAIELCFLPPNATYVTQSMN